MVSTFVPLPTKPDTKLHEHDFLTVGYCSSSGTASSRDRRSGSEAYPGILEPDEGIWQTDM